MGFSPIHGLHLRVLSMNRLAFGLGADNRTEVLLVITLVRVPGGAGADLTCAKALPPKRPAPGRVSGLWSKQAR
jgi:hypothetical protein